MIGCDFAQAKVAVFPATTMDHSTVTARRAGTMLVLLAKTILINEIKVIPVTTIQDDMAPSATGSMEASDIAATANGEAKEKSRVVAAPSGPAKDEKGEKGEPKATGGSEGSEASDDDLLDEETQSDKAAGNITKKIKPPRRHQSHLLKKLYVKLKLR